MLNETYIVKCIFMLAARMLLYFSKIELNAVHWLLPVYLVLHSCCDPENVYHKCSIILTYLCPLQCFAMKFHMPPMSRLSIVVAVKHWHSATIWYI